MDVMELDAASNRGIDDARDLRERAMFAPATSRYRIYILDEAHQLTKDAAAALLKLIEEPPPHLVFIFATTEPDKILATIRSRTHHYPFRLVAARRLTEHLAWVCEQEGVAAEPAALTLIARAGAGSVRDALSVLGQVMAGSAEAGLTYDVTIALLGYTDSAVLDDVVAAVADNDGARMFELVDSVIESGHDPRRFVTDLLERWRDLLLLTHIPESARGALFDRPDEEIASMAVQSARFTPAELVRAADLVAQGLADLKGATAPRLQLELLCARLLLPGSDDSSIGLLTRVDQIDRRLAALQSTLAEGGEVSVPSAPRTSPTRPQRSAASPEAKQPAARSLTPDSPPSNIASRDDANALPNSDSASGVTTEAATASTRVASAEPAFGARNSGVDLASVVAMWPAVLDALKAESRVTWTAFAQTSPVSVSDGAIAVAFPDQGRITFALQSRQDERLRAAILEVLKLDLRPDLVLSPDQAQSAAPIEAPKTARPTELPKPSESQETPDSANVDQTASIDSAAPGDAHLEERAREITPLVEPASEKIAPKRRTPRKIPAKSEPDAAVDLRVVDGDAPSVHDADVADGGLAGVSLVEKMLGGKVVTEIEGS